MRERLFLGFGTSKPNEDSELWPGDSDKCSTMIAVDAVAVVAVVIVSIVLLLIAARDSPLRFAEGANA